MRRAFGWITLASLLGCATAGDSVRASPSAAAAPAHESPAVPVDEAFTEAFGSPSDDAYRQNVTHADDTEYLRQREASKASRERAAVAVTAKNWVEAKAALAQWPAGVDEAARRELEVQHALGSGNAAAARSLAESWLAVCSTGDCRLDAITALEAAGMEVTGKKAAETCLLQSEEAQKLLPCLAAEEQDALNRARRALLTAKTLLNRPKDSRLRDALDTAQSACAQPRCLGVQAEAAQLVSEMFLKRRQLVDAARAALTESNARVQTLPPSQRRHYATEQAERLCAQLSRGRGPSCPELDKQAGRAPLFQDFSRKPTTQTFLSAATLRQVATHYQPTLLACAEDAFRAAGRDTLKFTLSWVIRGDGKVMELHVAGNDEGPLAQCLRSAASLWRYPQFSADAQRVEQTFTLRSKGAPASTPNVASSPENRG